MHVKVTGRLHLEALSLIHIYPLAVVLEDEVGGVVGVVLGGVDLVDVCPSVSQEPVSYTHLSRKRVPWLASSKRPGLPSPEWAPGKVPAS